MGHSGHGAATGKRRQAYPDRSAAGLLPDSIWTTHFESIGCYLTIPVRPVILLKNPCNI
jgi:hypothetical protein